MICGWFGASPGFTYRAPSTAEMRTSVVTQGTEAGSETQRCRMCEIVRLADRYCARRSSALRFVFVGRSTKILCSVTGNCMSGAGATWGLLQARKPRVDTDNNVQTAPRLPFPFVIERALRESVCLRILPWNHISCLCFDTLHLCPQRWIC